MRVYRGTFKVEWVHCDAAGIVFYPQFYTLFDQATERLFTANKLSYAELARDFDSPGMPLVETGAKYFNASRLGDTLAIESWVESWDGKTSWSSISSRMPTAGRPWKASSAASGSSAMPRARPVSARWRCPTR